MSKLIIVDGNNWYRRRAETSVTGTPTRDCFTEIQRMNDPVIVVWDGYHAKKARRDIYPEYKATRNTPAESFYESQKLFQQILGFSKAIQVKLDNYEGDDVIAAIVTQYRGQIDMMIESNDADLGQLGVVMSRATPLPEKPHYLALYKAIVGDPSDNIPGAKGFGKTTWGKLTDEQKNTLSQIILSGEQMTDEDITNKVQEFYPKGALKWFMIKENRAQLALFYKIVNFIPIPWAAIQAKMEQGLNRPDLAENIMLRFML